MKSGAKSNVTHIDFLRVARPGTGDEDSQPFSEKDFTHEIVQFLETVHGNIRVDEQGDYYYGKVSTISLHFLLTSSLPQKEVLWGWYAYFDRERSESIYQTLPPLQDETFLRVLNGCGFRWNAQVVRDSGLVFLSHHRVKVYLALEEFLTQRLEQHRSMDDEALRAFLTPHNTWSEAHLGRQVRALKTRPLAGAERRAVYDRFESDYLKATARQLMDEAAGEAFWKKPPPELEPLQARFKALTATLREQAMRLGVYMSREAYERRAWQEEGPGAKRSRRFGFSGRGPRPRPAGVALAEHFAVLGLKPSATLEEVKAAYREKVKAYHPDQGGTVPEFIRLQESYEFLLTEVF